MQSPQVLMCLLLCIILCVLRMSHATHTHAYTYIRYSYALWRRSRHTVLIKISTRTHWETTQQTRQSKGIKMCEAILSCCYTQDKTSRQQYVVVHVLSRGGACKRTGWSSKDMTWTSCMHLHSDLYTHGRCGARITNLIPSMRVY